LADAHARKRAILGFTFRLNVTSRRIQQITSNIIQKGEVLYIPARLKALIRSALRPQRGVYSGLMVTGMPLRTTYPPSYHKLVQFAASLGYYALICLVDRTILAPLFGYLGLFYASPSTLAQIGLLSLILVCTAVTPVHYRQPSDGVLYMLLYLVVIPIVAVAATDVIFTNVASDMMASISGAYLLLAAVAMVPRRPLNWAGRLSLRRVWLIVVLLSIVSYVMMFATFGTHFKLLSFSDVYSVRAVFDQQGSGVLDYLLNWQANVINPLFIVLGLRSRRALLVLAGALGDFLIYTVTGFKSVLFSVFAITAVLFALRQQSSTRRSSVIGMYLGLAFAALVSAAYAIDKIGHTFVWTSVFVRRMALVPGVNSGYYFQYFTFDAPKTHLAYGIIGALTGNSGATPPARQIASAIYHSTGDPNVNIWADAYANFGHVGVIAFTLVLAAFLWFFDRIAKNANRQIATVLITVSSLSLANSALFTCLLTHGMLLALLLVMLSPQLARQAGEAQGRHAKMTNLAFPAGTEMKLLMYQDRYRKRLAVRTAAAEYGHRRSLSRYAHSLVQRKRSNIWTERNTWPADRADQARVRKAGFTVLIGCGLGNAVGLLTTPIISRIFEPAIYGEFALITGVASVFLGVSTFRLEIRSLQSADDAEAMELIWLGLLTSVIWTAGLTLTAGLAVALWHVNVYCLFIGLIVFLPALENLGSAAMTRAQRYRSLAAGNFGQGASMGLIQLFLGMISPGVGALLAGFGLSRLCFLPALRNARCKLARAPALWRQNRRFATLAGSSALLNSLTSAAPIILVSMFYGNAEAGQLAIGIRVLVAPLGIISQSAAFANLGEVSRMLRFGDDNAARVVRQGMRDLFAVGLIPCALAGALGSWAVPLVLGQKWREAGLLLAAQAAGALAQFVAVPFSQLLNVTGDNRRLLIWDSGRFAATVLCFCIARIAGLSPVWAVGCWSAALVVVYFALARLVVRAVALHKTHPAAAADETVRAAGTPAASADSPKSGLSEAICIDKGVNTANVDSPPRWTSGHTKSFND
jgi:O-antigen/teichoic acid export membrane protein